MRKLITTLGVAAVFGVASSAWAADTSIIVTDNTDPYDAQATLLLQVDLASSIVLTLTGTAGNAISSGVDGSGSGLNEGTGTFAFGTANTSCLPQPANGVCVRNNAGTGALFVATIQADVEVAGAPSAQLGIQAAAVDTATEALNERYYRSCGRNTACANTDTFWGGNCGGGGCTAIPVASLGAELSAGILTGDYVQHEIALEVLDTEVATGAATTSVTYHAIPE